MAYIGAQPNKQLTKTTSQSFNGTGSATAFTLNRAVNTGEELEVFVDNVQQEPGVGKSYTATGTTLTFDEAPPSGTGNVYVIYRGQAEVTTRLEAPDLSITTAKLADDAVTSDKLAHDLTIQTSLSVPTIKDSSGSNTAITIDSSGRITKPKTPGFHATGQTAEWRTLPDAAEWTAFVGGTTHTTGQSGVLANKYAVNWTDTSGGGLGDKNSNFDTSTGVFTAPVSGLYHFHFNAYAWKLSTGSGNYCHINSAVDGGIQSDYTIWGHTFTNHYHAIDMNRIWFLNANQTFQFAIMQNVASTYSFYTAYVYFSGYLVG